MLVHEYVKNLVAALPMGRSVDIRYSEGTTRYTVVSISFRESKPMREPVYFIRHADARIYAPSKGAERVLVELTFRRFDFDRTQPKGDPKHMRMTKAGKRDYDLTEDMEVLVNAALSYILEGK